MRTNNYDIGLLIKKKILSDGRVQIQKLPQWDGIQYTNTDKRDQRLTEDPYKQQLVYHGKSAGIRIILLHDEGKCIDNDWFILQIP